MEQSGQTLQMKTSDFLESQMLNICPYVTASSTTVVGHVFVAGQQVLV